MHVKPQVGAPTAACCCRPLPPCCEPPQRAAAAAADAGIPPCPALCLPACPQRHGAPRAGGVRQAGHSGGLPGSAGRRWRAMKVAGQALAFSSSSALSCAAAATAVAAAAAAATAAAGPGPEPCPAFCHRTRCQVSNARGMQPLAPLSSRVLTVLLLCAPSHPLPGQQRGHPVRGPGARVPRGKVEPGGQPGGQQSTAGGVPLASWRGRAPASCLPASWPVPCCGLPSAAALAPLPASLPPARSSTRS